MKTEKTLIINPTKEQAKNLPMISSPETLRTLAKEVLRQATETFEPFHITDQMVRKFIQKVEMKVTAVNKHSGVLVGSIDEGIAALVEMGKNIYGPNWAAKVIKQELFQSKAKTVGVIIENDDLIAAVTKELEDLAEVIVNGQSVKAPLSNELVIETKAVKEARKKKEETNSQKNKTV